MKPNLVTGVRREGNMNRRNMFLQAAAVLAIVALPDQIARPANSMSAYDLAKVEGMEHFGGSTQARALLARNGFVVSDPFFRQLFEPYIKTQLPLFITTDSAWHTYHVLLEEGVKELEQIQSRRLAKFSRLLLDAANAQAARGEADFAELARYAEMGLAFQEVQVRESLAAAEKSRIETLRSGVGEVTWPIGFPLSAVNFRAASFYTQAPELADYFAARQWYASVVFRLRDARETRLALELAWLISSRAELSNLWHQLSVPFDVILAPTEDGDVSSYSEALRQVVGVDVSAAKITSRVAEAQQFLETRLPAPRINDQLLLPADYVRFGQVIKGFRLLPPRQLPCAVTFHHTTDPAIPKRMFPSGLDFLVASPTLRSPAAIRALELRSGKEVAAAAQKFNCEPFPDSLHGEAMKLLATLQKPPPAQAPPAMRTAAWADSQLWTQLGAWAEQRHTWALHTKISVSYAGMTDTPAGLVAPYPEFFASLGALTRKTAEALERAGLVEPFSVQAAGAEMLAQIKLRRQFHEVSRQARVREEDLMKEWSRVTQFERFFNSYCESRLKESRSSDAIRKAMDILLDELEALARRAADTGQANGTETETLRIFTTSRDRITQLLTEFAPVCERLAVLARKSGAGEQLTQDDEHWISAYGATLARFHFYEGNSYLVPRDDFPMVTRIFSSPVAQSVLYAGLGRPQALYVVIPAGGKQRLYQGAVMTYREFNRNASEPLDDESWRKLVFAGLTPPPPAFTRSFYAEADAKELLALIRREVSRKPKQGIEGDEDYEQSRQAEQAVELLHTRASRAELGDLFALVRKVARTHEDLGETLTRTIARLATPADLPELFALLPETARDQSRYQDGLVADVAEIIAALPWEPHQAQLVRWLEHPKPDVSSAALSILASRPEAIDVPTLVAGFDRQPPQTRRLYCRLFGKVVENAGAKKSLLRAARDTADGVRWQAVSAIYAAKWNDPTSIAALVARLDDTNWIVAAGAAYALGKLGAVEAAPALLGKFEAFRQLPPLPDEEWTRQISAASTAGMQESLRRNNPDQIPAHFLPLNSRQNRQRGELFSIFQPKEFRIRLWLDFAFEPVAIGALGELNHQPAVTVLLKELGGDYHTAAVEALRKLDPNRLEQTLFDLALDRRADGARRGLALNAICDSGGQARVHELLPLLDETAVIMPLREGADWRLCDHAAVVMSKLLEWEPGGQIVAQQTWRDDLIQKLREWAKSQP